MNELDTLTWRSELEAVVFDLGGTLFEHLAGTATDANLQCVVEPALKRPLSAEELAGYHALRRHTEHRFAEQPFFLHRDLVQQSFSWWLENLWPEVPQVQAAAQAFYRLQQELVTRSLKLRTDTVDTLSRLVAQGYRLAIVSNIDEDYLQPLLDRTPGFDCMEFILSSEAAGSCKPDPAIFEQALGRLKLRPESVLFVGDSYQNDVLGPRRLGMRTCWLIADHVGVQEKVAHADLAVQSLTELARALAGPSIRTR